MGTRWAPHWNEACLTLADNIFLDVGYTPPNLIAVRQTEIRRKIRFLASRLSSSLKLVRSATCD